MNKCGSEYKVTARQPLPANIKAKLETAQAAAIKAAKVKTRA